MGKKQKKPGKGKEKTERKTAKGEEKRARREARKVGEEDDIDAILVSNPSRPLPCATSSVALGGLVAAARSALLPRAPVLTPSSGGC